MKLNLTKPFAIFDLETTGINVTSDRIVEISILKLNPNGASESKTMRLNPTIPIPREASEIHGIFDDDLKDAPTFAEEGPTIALFLNDCDIGGYNSNRFDIPLLIEEFLRIGIDFDISNRKLVDMQAIFHQKEKRDLTAAYRFYCDKTLEGAHGAEADVQATYEVLLGQLERYDDLKNDIDFLHAFSQEGRFVDLGRRMVYKDNIEVFNFGKHKGKPVAEVLRDEPQYYNWIMNSDFMQHTKQKLKEIKDRQKITPKNT